MNRISLCMIVRDEEEYLPRCLESARDLVSEIILVDTGSEDKTKEIASQFGAKILKFRWNDDFSAARNFSIAAASGDWILVLDADEILHESSHDAIRKACEKQNTCYYLTQRHYVSNPCISGFVPCRGEFKDLEKDIPGYFESALIRLFPRDERIQYRNRIHELVEHSVAEHADLSSQRLNVLLHHYGPLKPKRRREAKAQLYTDLGKRKAHETPQDWKALHELGVEHNCNGRLLESAQAFDKACQLNPNYVDTWINYGYVLCELRKFDLAVQALERALKLHPRSAEAWSNLGVVYLRIRRPNLAVAAFSRAVNLNPEYASAWCNLGDSYLNSALPQHAAAAFQKALALVKDSANAVEGLGVAAFMSGNLVEAEKLLSKSKDRERGKYWYGHLQRLTKDASKSI